MSDYTSRVTIICPEAMVADANQLALVLGESAGDDRTFRAAGYEDAGGNRYAVASSLVKPVFFTAAGSPLTAPDHAPEADLAAASRAQSAVAILDPAAPVQAAPGRVLAIPGDDAAAALSLAGVTAVEVEG
ncbi:hypothetical protein [Aquicoccus sp. SU-CL01552]|uniref:hypothetical protein n=1 Tax=Aquicoccus sp. SU-CL01552 TaxID=3127656 RepID=UPI003108D21F